MQGSVMRGRALVRLGSTATACYAQAHLAGARAIQAAPAYPDPGVVSMEPGLEGAGPVSGKQPDAPQRLRGGKRAATI
jgi:hypothetical protein